MKIQYMSDLHIEGSNMSAIPECADVLVLAGDIAAYPQQLCEFFYSKVSATQQVVYVLGNHEHEYQHIRQANSFYKELLAEFSNVHVLEQECITISDVNFIGGTLWSNFEGEGLQAKNALKEWVSHIADFSRIKSDFDYITPDEMEIISQKTREYIKDQLTQKAGQKNVVVTHFAPCLASRSPQEFDSKIGSGYWANDMPDLTGQSLVHIHGHVHCSKDYFENGTRIVCNPRGYSKLYDVAQNALFSPSKVIEV